MSLIDDVKKMAGDAIANNADQLIGSFIKQQLQSGNVNQITTIVTELIGDQGSIGGFKALIAKFDTANLSELIQSWIGSGKNIPFTMDQVKSVFGEDWIQTLSEKIGVNPAILTGLISQFLPSVVDEATKDGNVPNENAANQINITELLTSFIK
ncbi:MAG: YidB family protein [Neisseriaceae bacterium]|nr:DUF937 domain-containing protein [Neisseriaceae bacterium PsAf]MCV2502515.1 YidB family protein [Neisseriaceae bacterium]MCV2509418.1 YidB family protein [Neisseriaceae bacterium]